MLIINPLNLVYLDTIKREIQTSCLENISLKVPCAMFYDNLDIASMLLFVSQTSSDRQ